MKGGLGSPEATLDGVMLQVMLEALMASGVAKYIVAKKEGDIDHACPVPALRAIQGSGWGVNMRMDSCCPDSLT